MKLKFYITFDTDTNTFEVSNVETGEIHVSTIKSKSKKPKIEESTIPQLILEDSKYILNTEALKLMGIAPGDRIDIKFDTKGNPIIGTDKAFGTEGSGNLLTKSNTVRYSGVNNERLSELGKIFVVEKQQDNNNLFVLQYNTKQEPETTIDEVIEPEDFDLTDLLDENMMGLDFNLN